MTLTDNNCIFYIQKLLKTSKPGNHLGRLEFRSFEEDKTEWGKSKTYYKAINDWATLPSALKKLMPKTIFKYKLKQFY